MKEIILASASARRSQILSSCNIPHRIVLSGVEEIIDKEKEISEIVQINAISKAEKVAGENTSSIVIGADTLVAHDGDIIGKPGEEGEAKALLERFSGSSLDVYTGLCVIDSKTSKKAIGFKKSELKVVKISQNEINRFLPLLAPYDKAGGFSIEGAGSFLFDDIKGSYFNILGLPMIKLKELFDEVGLDILYYLR